jgi:hypothetical protein
MFGVALTNQAINRLVRCCRTIIGCSIAHQQAFAVGWIWGGWASPTCVDELPGHQNFMRSALPPHDSRKARRHSLTRRAVDGATDKGPSSTPQLKRADELTTRLTYGLSNNLLRH